MRVGQVKTQSQIQQLKGEDYGLQRQSQRWKKEIELKQEVKQEEKEQ